VETIVPLLSKDVLDYAEIGNVLAVFLFLGELITCLDYPVWICQNRCNDTSTQRGLKISDVVILESYKSLFAEFIPKEVYTKRN